MNIFSNYIPNRLITVDDKDTPWMNENIKKKIMAKKYETNRENKLFRCLLSIPVYTNLKQ